VSRKILWLLTWKVSMETNKLFVYGILKKGFELDLEKLGATYISKATLPCAELYRIGSGVGLRKHTDPYRVVHGEVFEIPNQLNVPPYNSHSFVPSWEWLDSIENNGFTYTREIVDVELFEPFVDEHPREDRAWVYVHTYGDRLAEYYGGVKYYTDENRIHNGIYTGTAIDYTKEAQ
jgi:gamma-glutamylcyclotransferase (GGCT)/AIG2-like uncharacterized protein YtfP